MAVRKMTFSLPERLASEFVKRVPARNRSRYVAEAVAQKLRERERLLARAADIANRSRAVRSLEQEMNTLSDEPTEPWGYRTGSLNVQLIKLHA
jgi:metal-responsive CopG/Arc/MetJ family transcriptional regulator